MTKKANKNLNILRTKRAYKMTQKVFSIIFKGISVARNCLRSGSPPFKVVILVSFLGILHEIGLLHYNEIIKVQKSDLVSNFTGDTETKTEKKKIKQVFDAVLFIGEANTLTSKSEKDFKKKKGIESIMRYMFPSAGPAQHPVFIVAGYN